jgi:hypothetical protein
MSPVVPDEPPRSSISSKAIVVLKWLSEALGASDNDGHGRVLCGDSSRRCATVLRARMGRRAVVSALGALGTPAFLPAMIVALVFAAPFVVRAARLRLVVSSGQVEIHNMLRTYVLAVERVTAFELTSGPGMANPAPRVVARLTDGTVVRISALRREGWGWRLSAYREQLAPLVALANAALAQNTTPQPRT